MNAGQIEAVFAWIGALAVALGLLRLLALMVSNMVRARPPREAPFIRQAVDYRMARYGEDEDMARLAVERRLAGIAQHTVWRVK